MIAYNGAYTHEDVFDMGLDRAYSYRLLHKEQSEYNERLQEVKREFQSKQK